MAKETGVRVAKGVLYVLSRIVIVAVVIALIVVAYYTAVNTMNVNMIVKDAFAKRTEAVLMPAADGSNAETLKKLFTQNALATDNILNSGVYADESYTINGYYQRADIEPHIVWSWSDKADILVTDVVRDIAAQSNLPPDENTGRTPEPDVPDWPTGVYEVEVVRDSVTDAWKIDKVELKEPIVFPKEPEATGPPKATDAAPSASPAATVIAGTITD